MERRKEPRRAFAELYCNRFIDGFPHMAKVLDLSPSGMRVRCIAEPAHASKRIPVELLVPGRHATSWLWTKPVRRVGETDVLSFVGLDPIERARLAKLCRSAP